MLLSVYEGMLKERLENVCSKSGYARNFIIGECYGVIRLAMIDPDVTFDESTYLWDLIAIELQKLSLSDFTENSELSDNIRSAAKIRELCLWAVNESIDEYTEHSHDSDYCRGLIDGLIMYCDIYCDCPEELNKLKERETKKFIERLDKWHYI